MPDSTPFYMKKGGFVPIQTLNQAMRDIFGWSPRDLSKIDLYHNQVVVDRLLTRATDEEKSYVGVIVVLNRAILLNKSDLILASYEQLLIKYNTLLTEKAKELISRKNGEENDTSEAGTLEKIFNAKKELAKHWYALQADAVELGPDNIQIESVHEAIDNLQKYTLNDMPGKARGRYLQAEEYLGWGRKGFSRTQKLTDVLSYADQLVFGTQKARTAPQKPPSLENGRLRGYVTLFFQKLTTFFRQFAWQGKIKVVSLMTPTKGTAQAGGPPSAPTSEPRTPTKLTSQAGGPPSAPTSQPTTPGKLTSQTGGPPSAPTSQPTTPTKLTSPTGSSFSNGPMTPRAAGVSWGVSSIFTGLSPAKLAQKEAKKRGKVLTFNN